MSGATDAAAGPVRERLSGFGTPAASLPHSAHQIAPKPHLNHQPLRPEIWTIHNDRRIGQLLKPMQFRFYVLSITP